MHGDELVPVTDDPDTAGFWQAAREGRLAVQRCQRCENPIHLPKAFCSECGSWETQWVSVAPRGAIYSWTTVERTVREAFPAPYTIIVVELEELPGVRLVGHLAGRPHLHAGDLVEATFEPRADAVLPTWQLSSVAAENASKPG